MGFYSAVAIILDECNFPQLFVPSVFEVEAANLWSARGQHTFRGSILCFHLLLQRVRPTLGWSKAVISTLGGQTGFLPLAIQYPKGGMHLQQLTGGNA